MSGRSRRWLTLIGVTVLVALLRPPLPPGKRPRGRPPIVAPPWHKATEEALLRAEEELQDALHGADELDRPADPDRLAVMPGVPFLLRVIEPGGDFENTSIKPDPVCVTVTHDSATTHFIARIQVKINGVEIAGRERHTHWWTQDGDTWHLTESDVAVFTDVP